MHSDLNSGGLTQSKLLNLHKLGSKKVCHETITSTLPGIGDFQIQQGGVIPTISFVNTIECLTELKKLLRALLAVGYNEVAPTNDQACVRGTDIVEVINERYGNPMPDRVTGLPQVDAHGAVVLDPEPMRPALYHVGQNTLSELEWEAMKAARSLAHARLLSAK